MQGLLGEEWAHSNRPDGHEGQVTPIKFYPADGRRMPNGRLAPPVSLATASRDATARLLRRAETRGLDPEEGSRGTRRAGPFCGATSPHQWHRLRRDGRLARLSRLRPQAIVWDARVVPAGHGGSRRPSLDDATVDAPTVGGARV